MDLMMLITEQQLNHTKELLEQKIESLVTPAAIHQILKMIAERFGLKYVVFNSNEHPVSPDLYNKSIDFALENEIITESAFHLLGSEEAGHWIKGFSLYLKGSRDDVSKDKVAKSAFADEVREKLARVHNTTPQNIIIHAFAFERGTTVHYGVKNLRLNQDQQQQLSEQMQKEFPKTFERLGIHSSFTTLGVDFSSFQVEYNRDYRIKENVPQNEQRGGLDYNPPVGFYRYGMKVLDKYDNGDNTWLGMVNGKGEWGVAYHGTPYRFVKSISETPLRVGDVNVYGRGIYCSPYVDVAEQYSFELDFPINGEIEKLKYVFMCRVNVSNIHRCTEPICPEAENPKYTVHFTTNSNIWFANLKNSKYESIRQYGILINLPKKAKI
jgi:hypothetical protein